MRNKLGEYLVDYATKDEKLRLLVGDIGFGIFDKFIEKHPEKFINCGIAEQNMIGTAAGLADNGFHVVVYTIIPFLVYRPFDFIRNLIAHQNIPVCLIGVGGGFSYDTLGFTHYAKEDLTLIGSLPNFNIYTPYDSVSAVSCFESAFDFKSPTYIRLMKGGEPDINVFRNEDGFSILNNFGNDFLIITHGSIAINSSIAANELSINNNINGKVIAIYDINKINTVFKNVSCKILIIEEHNAPGIFLTKLIEENQTISNDIYTMFTNRNTNQLVSTREDILKQQNLDSKSIVNKILNILKFK